MSSGFSVRSHLPIVMWWTREEDARCWPLTYTGVHTHTCTHVRITHISRSILFTDIHTKESYYVYATWVCINDDKRRCLSLDGNLRVPQQSRMCSVLVQLLHCVAMAGGAELERGGYWSPKLPCLVQATTQKRNDAICNQEYGMQHLPDVC